MKELVFGLIILFLFILIIISIVIILCRYFTIDDKNNFFVNNYLYFLPLFILCILVLIFTICFTVYSFISDDKPERIIPRRSSSSGYAPLPLPYPVTMDFEMPIRSESSRSIDSETVVDRLTTGSYFPSPEQISMRCPPEESEGGCIWKLINEAFLNNESPFFINLRYTKGENPIHLKFFDEKNPYFIIHPWSMINSNNGLSLFFGENFINTFNRINDCSIILPIIKNSKRLFTLSEEKHFVLLIIEKRGRQIFSYIIDPKSSENPKIIEDNIRYIFNSSVIEKKNCDIKSDQNTGYFVIKMMHKYIKDGADIRENGSLYTICPLK